MTPEEKAKHLEALEDMYLCALEDVYEQTGIRRQQSAEERPDVLAWRAAIDAFERLADHDHEADNVCDILHQVRKLCVQPERDAYGQLEARSENETVTVAQLRSALKGRK